jgi:glycosyltransferase involved in cell wall biosynthesis
VKACFYLLDGVTNASSHQRALQFFPFLRRHGVEPHACLPVAQPAYTRLVEESPGRTVDKALYYSLFGACRLRDVMRARDADVVAIQRDLFPFGPPVLERVLFRLNPRLVYDTDDATYLRPSFTPRTPFQRLRRFDKVAEVIARSRWVSVATEPIATWARQYNANVSVVPMAVDAAEYDRVQPSARTFDGLVVGWAGTAGGLRYLEALGPVLRLVAQRHPIVVRVISGGYRRVRLPGLPVDARPWRAETALQDMKAFDVGLVPLDDTPFERAKFPFKLLQYLALGVPSVSARVGIARTVIRDGENGLLADSPAEWYDALDRLLGDVAAARRIAACGRQTVAASYSLERVAPLLLEGLTRAAAA